jgi:SAM-dependent methyltransferase
MKEDYLSLLVDLENFYDRVGPRYELIYPNLIESNKIIAESLIQLGLIKTDAIIADFACSGGWLVFEINKLLPTTKLLGVDISSESISFAENNKSKDSNISFLRTDWLSLNNEFNEYFDIALCTGNSLTHFPIEIQVDIIYSFSKTIKKNGVLILDTYKNWNNRLLENICEIEPKGLTRLKEIDIVTCFFNVFNNNVAERNICFSTYNSKDRNAIKPRTFEKYITHQYPFVVKTEDEIKMYGFSKIEKIAINDGIGIFDYFKLTK